jgi:hypothetical protein
MYPIMARQPGLMAQQVLDRDAVGRDGIVQAKFRKIVAYRLGPIEPLLVVKDFVIEQITNCVWLVTGRFASMSRKP